MCMEMKNVFLNHVHVKVEIIFKVQTTGTE